MTGPSMNNHTETARQRIESGGTRTGADATTSSTTPNRAPYCSTTRSATRTTNNNTMPSAASRDVAGASN